MKSQATWAPSPPPAPSFGEAWVNTSASSLSPTLACYDGNSWVSVGVIDTLAVSLTPASGIRTVDATAGSINLASYAEIVLIVNGVSPFDPGPAQDTQLKILIFSSDGALLSNVEIARGAAIVCSCGDVAVLAATPRGNWRLVSFFSAGAVGGDLSLHAIGGGLVASAGFALPQTSFSYGSNPVPLSAAPRMGVGSFGGKYQTAVPALPAWGYFAGNATKG
jgi:hypothetical protein